MGISVSDEELTQFSDHYRLITGLNSADETLAFFHRIAINQDIYEDLCEAKILISKIKKEMATQKSVLDYYMAHRAEFEKARISQIIVDSKNLANELMMRIEEDGEDFHTLARQYNTDDDLKWKSGYVGIIYRNMLPSDLASKIFTSEPGTIIDPLEVDGFHYIVKLEELIKPSPESEEVQRVVEEVIWNEWCSGIINQPFTVTDSKKTS
ncbi:conserved hypothetical protein [Desulfamplus magnetovallimortis]|uniref:peptidylprolyl isomerase n=1 Tax=Desulfamplus magnetovallimortis TaxID=1246637 RepID=A0A1W1H9M3_9BACT|nr:peptidylprolyl isomerase [Desulfamplus magnetovallimortis]SLM29144.1 conserved hypothetical protein [Desulfamplus magnetovallimortis]